MRLIRPSDSNFQESLRAMTAPSSLFDPVIEERTRSILQDVQARGDEAVLELTERFDGAKLSAEQLAATQAELMSAALQADDSLRSAVSEAEKNIASFAKRSRRKSW